MPARPIVLLRLSCEEPSHSDITSEFNSNNDIYVKQEETYTVKSIKIEDDTNEPLSAREINNKPKVETSRLSGYNFTEADQPSEFFRFLLKKLVFPPRKKNSRHHIPRSTASPKRSGQHRYYDESQIKKTL